MIGLGVMGRNLALNLADCGYRVAMFDRAVEAATRIAGEYTSASNDRARGSLIACATLRELVGALSRPRIFIVLVPAGAPVDAVCTGLISDGIEPDDIVVDCGNSLFTDTARREQNYRGKLTFFGSGISGGSEGARHGPSLMPGGDNGAWRRLKPIWEAIAAKVDPSTGREISSKGDQTRLAGGEPCTAYIGPGGAGHYVKMVHNGIEYADMQLIAEAYHLLRETAGLRPRDIAAVFREWNAGELESYLIEITAEILEMEDRATGRPLIEMVLDAAGQKGTGAWSAINAMELGVATPSIAEAVFARALSALKDERVRAAGVLPSPSGRGAGGEGELHIAHAHDLNRSNRQSSIIDPNSPLPSAMPSIAPRSARTRRDSRSWRRLRKNMSGTSTWPRSRESGGAVASSARACCSRLRVRTSASDRWPTC